MNNQNSLAYANELLRVYWMALCHPNVMNNWSDALQAVVTHDHNQSNVTGYVMVRHNETGVIHLFSDFTLKISARYDINRGIYTLIADNIRIENNPNPLTEDRLIPFVIPNWTCGSMHIDNTKIPSPTTGYVPSLINLVSDDMYETISESLSNRYDDFKLLGDYVIGFLRLKTNDIKDGIEYAYLYHGGKHPSKGLHVYLRQVNDWNKNHRIWTDHCIKGTDNFSEMYSVFEPQKVDKPLYDSLEANMIELRKYAEKLTYKGYRVNSSPRFFLTDGNMNEEIMNYSGSKLAPLHCVEPSFSDLILRNKDLTDKLGALVSTVDTHAALLEPFIWNKFDDKYKLKLKKERRQIKTPYIHQWDSKIQMGYCPFYRKIKGISLIASNLIDSQYEFGSGNLPVPGAEEDLKKVINLIQDSDK